MAEVREVCDYILIISKGKLVASDTPENLERNLGDSDLIEIETKADPDGLRFRRRKIQMYVKKYFRHLHRIISRC